MRAGRTRLAAGAIISCPANRQYIPVEILAQGLRRLRQPALGITHGGRWISYRPSRNLRTTISRRLIEKGWAMDQGQADGSIAAGGIYR